MTAQHLLINASHPEEFRVALVEGQSLEGFFIETATRGKVVGNIYKGIVVNVQPSLQAAFVDYGADRNGFLPISEIHPDYYATEVEGHPRIQDVLKTGQEVLVQVTKEEIGTKGAALTTYVSIAGRYVVIAPGQSQRGVSRKIEDEAQRERLREIAQELELPEEMGIILRTAAEGRTKREIQKDLRYLMRIWDEILKRVQESQAPCLIYRERDLAIRVVRDYFTPSIKTIWVDDMEIFRRVKEFLRIISPRHQHVVKLYKGDAPLFNKYNLEDQIDQLFQKRVPLKSGGYLIIDPTEALVAIDVNSGRATRDSALEESSYRVNLEAAQEIPKQLRLRDLGGLIVVDFIDMRSRQHIRNVERRLRDETKKDKAKIKVGRISQFGLLEISRQHLGLNIQLGSYRDCPYCEGTGMVRSTEASAVWYLRKIWNGLLKDDVVAVRGRFSTDVAHYLLNRKRNDLVYLEDHFGKEITIEASSQLAPHEGHLEFVTVETEEKG
ncbi:MAG: Rne/Rng family ribonuclease [Desulfacinum sp.]|jgi:ribonuclease E|nr:Rne/Rng family ribonuclease [Desulfacinum sp.]